MAGSRSLGAELYERIDSGETCYYCGEPADTYDHFPPISRRYDAPKIARVMVRCCGECNSVLGPSMQATLHERVRHLKVRLRNRYQRDLRCPDWSEEELNSLGKVLRSSIEVSIRKRDTVMRRINYVNELWEV